MCDEGLIVFAVVNPFFPLLFRESGREGGGERERETNVRETSIGCPHTCPDAGQDSNLQPRYVPLTGNQTHDSSALEPTLTTGEAYEGLIFVFLMLLILERKGKGERLIDWMPPARPLLGIEPTTWVCALTGNRTMIWFIG
uniref:Uncharacterized protein n=1 Tax=Myotis myotis TaxID=51298 RepID=A0A7J7T612_MYOMY|nr:hypothetical protein mMyoMyo1_009210 [Myotis myotis]